MSEKTGIYLTAPFSIDNTGVLINIKVEANERGTLQA